MQQRALPRAGGADDGDELPPPHFDVDAAQDLEQLPVSAREDPPDGPASEERVHSYRIAVTGSSPAAWMLGYSGARVAITRLAATTATASRGLISTGRWSMK